MDAASDGTGETARCEFADARDQERAEVITFDLRGGQAEDDIAVEGREGGGAVTFTALEVRAQGKVIDLLARPPGPPARGDDGQPVDPDDVDDGEDADDGDDAPTKPE